MPRLVRSLLWLPLLALGLWGRALAAEAVPTEAAEAADAAEAAPEAAVHERYTLEDGATLPRGAAALAFKAGYPSSAVAFVLAPLRYFDLGVLLLSDYWKGRGTIELGLPLRAQLLENEAATLNMALAGELRLAFRLWRKNAQVGLPVALGVNGGWRFHARLCWFAKLRYLLHAPLSPQSRFAQGPLAQSGLEIATQSPVNVVLGGEAVFWNYHPRDFTYGGFLGLNLALWH